MKRTNRKSISFILCFFVCVFSVAGILYAGFGGPAKDGGLLRRDLGVEVAPPSAGSQVADEQTIDLATGVTVQDGAIARHVPGHYRVGSGRSISDTGKIGSIVALKETTSDSFRLTEDIFIDVAGLDVVSVFGGKDRGLPTGATGGFKGTFYGEGHSIYIYSSQFVPTTVANPGVPADADTPGFNTNAPGGTTAWDGSREPTGYVPLKEDGLNGIIFDLINGGRVYDLNIVLDVDILAVRRDDASRFATAMGILTGGIKGATVIDNVHITVNHMFGAFINRNDGVGQAVGIVVGGVAGTVFGGANLTINNSSVTLNNDGTANKRGILYGRSGGGGSTESTGDDTKARVNVGGYFGE